MDKNKPEKTKILVVDDDEKVCTLIKAFLTKHNYEVLTAFNSMQALETVQKEKPPLVLLDIRLGNESGLDIRPRIKAVSPKTDVIMVTAVQEEDSIRKAKTLGADSYITKPFTAAYLTDMLLQKISSLSMRHKK